MAANGIDDDQTRSYTALAAGTRVSHYKIISRIGAGGMGEVYLAEDTELNRKVALKFLPTHLCQDQECRSRFKREAQAAAKLDHPNIVSVFEVSEFKGRPYFSMQHVEGQPLKEVNTGKTVPLNRIIEIGIQVCEGLQAAHEKGVTHRDIKPSNILIDSHGRARIVDFGLASVLGSDRLTKTGSALGTIGYMSPEQAQGLAVDHRSDLFSMGVVLYELITGQNPFVRDSELATLRAASEDKPHPLARYCSGVPEGLQGIIDKALAKEATMRYQHADEMLADLRREKEVVSRPGLPSVGFGIAGSRRKWQWGIPIVLILVAAIVAAFLHTSLRHPAYVAAQRRQITFFGDAVMPEISPDGKYLAFVRPSPSHASSVVLVQDLAGGAPITVFEDKGVWYLRWSPDGSELLFSAFNDSVSSLVVVPRMGGSFRRYSIVGTGSTWSPDGTRFATVAQGIYFIDRKTGDTSSIRVDTVIYNIDWSPNGERLALSVTDSSGWFIGTCNIHGKEFHRITDSIRAINPKWSADGSAIYFLEDRGESPPNLYKIRVDAKSGERRGDPILLVSSLQGGQYIYSLSADDKKLVFRQQVRSSNLWLIRIGGPGDEKPQTTQLTSGTFQVFEPSLSPDVSQIAFAMTVQDEMHIFTIPVEGGSPKQITHTNTGNRFPVWSPDGLKMAYAPTSESPKIAVIDANGGMPTFFEQSVHVNDLVWSPGKWILCGTRGNCELLDPGNRIRERLLADDVNGYISFPCYSPDGSKVALITTEYEGDYHLRGETTKELQICSVRNHSKLWSTTAEPGMRLLGWSKDGHWLYFALVYDEETTVSRFRIDDRTKAPVFKLPWGDVYDLVMGADCRTFVCVRGKAQSDIWMIENFDPEAK